LRRPPAQVGGLVAASGGERPGTGVSLLLAGADRRRADVLFSEYAGTVIRLRPAGATAAFSRSVAGSLAGRFPRAA